MTQPMQQKLNRFLTRGTNAFASFTAGQKAVAVVGTAALLIAAFMVFRWVSAPSYSPLYSNLSGEDASAVIEELDASGIPYEISGGGGTISVPRADVYGTRITLSGKGLPSSSEAGYSLLDDQSLSTSESQEQTNFKRAMEGELSQTIEAIDGVDTAVVHLALPEKQVFSDEQDPATASVLVDTAAGATLDDEKVQTVVHLVASSIDGLEPKKVTVADATGKVLTSDSADGGTGAASARAKEVRSFEQSMQDKVQIALDQVVGIGNSTTTVTADLDFDKSTTKSRKFSAANGVPPLSESTTSETYNGAGSPNDGAGGVVGSDGQMDPPAAGDGTDSNYENKATTRDNAVDEVVEERVTAPGAVNSLHATVFLDATTAANIQPEVIEDAIASAIGIKASRGDTIEVTALPFDRSADEAAAKEIAAAQKADAAAAKNALLRNVGIGGGIALMVLLAWFQARRRARAREDATSYVVEQLKLDAASRMPQIDSTAMAALEVAETTEEDTLREDLIALVEKQPEDVASLLRGWLVEPRP